MSSTLRCARRPRLRTTHANHALRRASARPRTGSGTTGLSIRVDLVTTRVAGNFQRGSCSPVPAIAASTAAKQGHGLEGGRGGDLRVMGRPAHPRLSAGGSAKSRLCTIK